MIPTHRADRPTMSQFVPNRFLFKFEFPVYRCAAPPKIDGNLTSWDARFRLPSLHEIDDQSGFATLLVTWDDGGLYVGCSVKGKRRPPHCDPKQFWKSDNLRVMTDMRDTRNIRRATRYCQQFFFLPAGGGRQGNEAIAGSARVHRAAEDAPVIEPGRIPVASKISESGYSLTAHFPTEVLHGFNPAENPRIGLFCIVEDRELGQQSLTVGDELNWWINPSTWPTAVLMER